MNEGGRRTDRATTDEAAGRTTGSTSCSTPCSTSNRTALTRRRLLAAGATAGAIATAGCLGTREGAVPAPVVTDDRIDEDWRLIDESAGTVFEETVGPVTIRALERTLVYEYVDLAEALAETFDAEGSPTVFFATRIDLRPAIDRLPGGIGFERLMEEVRPAAEEAFRQQLRESGLENVTLEETDTATVASGHTATTALFTADFPIEGETPLPDGSTESIDGVLEVEARLGVWHDGTDVMLSGGAYPTEPVSEVLSRSLPDGVDADLVLDEAGGDSVNALSTEPETFAEAVDALLVSVE